MMNKISKNIKKLRSEQGFTQDKLAEELHVTRQAISSWETGRTQPDSQMLISLSEVFSVPIEMLIYGEKRNTTVEEGNKTYMSTATVIIAVLGSLLVAGGIGLIFTALWQELSIALKAVFAFIPMIAGQAFTFYVIRKRRSSFSFCEGASVLWSAGVIITLALINSIFSIHLGYANCLILDAVMILPIILMLDAVSPLALYFYMVLHWTIETAGYYGTRESMIISIITYIVCFLGVAFGLLFVKSKKEKLGEIRYLYSQWVSVVAVIVFTYISIDFFSFDMMFTLLAAAIAIFALDKEDKLHSPFLIIGTVGSLGVSVYTYFLFTMDIDPTFYTEEPLKFFIGYVLFAVILATSLMRNKDIVFRNRLKLSEILVFMLILLVTLINYAIQQMGIASLSGFVITASEWIILLLAFMAGVVFIFHGAKENRLFFTNIGFIADGGLAYYLLITSDASLLVNGLALLTLGGILLSINLLISRRKKEAELK
ncbi:MAG: DUF2157 domain-containing protein [Clostridia bacterium]|nr:DUF2157 domain-containing protein [Clostridia bacterium]